MITNTDSEIAKLKQSIQDQKERCEFFNDIVKESKHMQQTTKSYYFDKRLFGIIQNLMPEAIWDRDWFVAHANNETFPDERYEDAARNMDRKINLLVMDEANKAAAEAKLVMLEAKLEMLEAMDGGGDVSDMEAKLAVLEAKLMELEAVAAARRVESVATTGDDEASNYDIRFDWWRQERTNTTSSGAWEALYGRLTATERAPDDDADIVAARAARRAAWTAATTATEGVSTSISQPETRPVDTGWRFPRPRLSLFSRPIRGGMATRKKNRRRKRKTKHYKKKTKRYTKKRNMRY